MVWVEEFWLEVFNNIGSLLDGHCVWLIDRQKSDIYTLEGKNGFVILGIAGNIDCSATEGNQIAAILACCGVEVGVTLCGIIGVSSLNGNTLERL